MNNMSNKIDKSLVTIILLDILGQPIKNALYQIKVNNILIAQGKTNSKGAVVDISRDKGVILDIFFLSITNEMKLIKRVRLSKKYSIVRLYSPSILIKTELKEVNYKKGNYVRKTYIVKKGDSLYGIAKEYSVSMNDIKTLNNIKDVDKIFIGQVLKIPVQKENKIIERNGGNKTDGNKTGGNELGSEILNSGKDIYDFFKKQILNVDVQEISKKNVNSKSTGSPKTELKDHSPAIIFPFKIKPINDLGEELKNFYWAAELGNPNASMANFGWNRAGGRKHAGIDLYSKYQSLNNAIAGFDVFSIAPGIILDKRSFYCSTDQVTISHTTKDNRKFIVRYGELDPNSIKIKIGDIVKQGDLIGKTGVLKNNSGHPISIYNGKNISMLHFELYCGLNSSLTSISGNFSLTNNTAPYRRRNDLISPRAILLEGYRNSFNFTTHEENTTNTRKSIASLCCSGDGKKFIKSWEGGYFTPDKSFYYNDSVGYCTVGWGHLVAKKSCSSLGFKDKIDFISIDLAKKYFEDDVKKHEELVKKAIHVPLYQFEFDALMSLSFNIGNLAVKAPKLCKLINSKDYVNGPKEMLDINKADGKFNKGLDLRRKQEYRIFTVKNYDSKH